MKYYVNASFLSLKSITGISRFALSMSYELKKKLGDDIIFLAPKRIAHPDIAKKLNAVQIGNPLNYFIKDLNKARLIWEQTDLPLYLVRKGNPLLISFGNTAPLYYRNQIVSVLDLFYEHYKELLPNQYLAYPKREVQFYKFVIPRILHSAKQIITISDYSKRDIIKQFAISPDIIKIIYPTVSSLFLNRSNFSESSNQYDQYVLGVSSVNPHKNFEGLIRAFQKAELPGVKLVIVGNVQTDQEKYSLYHLYKNDSRIVFTGFVSDQELISLYRHALFFAFPSFFEGFGIPPLEAMACGCPTLVSNTASMPEICGDASLYVDPFDIDDISHAMLRMYSDSDLRQQLVRNGYTQVDKFNSLTLSNSVQELISNF